jgi:ribosomal protein L37AE/L43A
MRRWCPFCRKTVQVRLSLFCQMWLCTKCGACIRTLEQELLGT